MNVIKKTMKVIIGDHKKGSSAPNSPTHYKRIISQIKSDTLWNLPSDVQRSIVVRLSDVSDICHFMLVSKACFLLGNSELVWQDLCFYHYYMMKKTKDTWYESFRHPPSPFGTQMLSGYEQQGVLSGGMHKDVVCVKKIRTGEVFGLHVYKIGSNHLSSNPRLCYKYLSSWFEHPFLLKCYEFAQPVDSDKVYIVVDYLIDGLFSPMMKKERFSKKAVQFIMAQIILASQFMYNKGVPCKCGTAKLESNGYIKLDWLSHETLGVPLSHRVSIIDAYEYSAPEFVEGGEYTVSCLFWGFGCMIYQLIQGEALLQNTATNVMKLAREIMTLEVSFSNYFDEVTKDLVGKLLEKDPESRMKNFEECKNHKFFQDMDWHALFNKQLVVPDELQRLAHADGITRPTLRCRSI